MTADAPGPADLDTLVGWVDNAFECAAVEVDIWETDITGARTERSSLARLVRCLRTNDLLDEGDKITLSALEALAAGEPVGEVADDHGITPALAEAAARLVGRRDPAAPPDSIALAAIARAVGLDPDTPPARVALAVQDLVEQYRRAEQYRRDHFGLTCSKGHHTRNADLVGDPRDEDWRCSHCVRKALDGAARGDDEGLVEAVIAASGGQAQLDGPLGLERRITINALRACLDARRRGDLTTDPGAACAAAAPADAVEARARAVADLIRKGLAHRLGITSLRPLDDAADRDVLLALGRQVVDLLASMPAAPEVAQPSPAAADNRPRAEHPCPDCGGEVLRIEHAMDPATYRCRDQFDCAWESETPPADPDQPDGPPQLSWSAEKDGHAWVVLGRDSDAPADESVCVSLRVVEAVDPDSGEDVSELLAHAVRELLAVDWRGRAAALLARCDEIRDEMRSRSGSCAAGGGSISAAEVRALLGGGENRG